MAAKKASGSSAAQVRKAEMESRRKYSVSNPTGISKATGKQKKFVKESVSAASKYGVPQSTDLSIRKSSNKKPMRGEVRSTVAANVVVKSKRGNLYTVKSSKSDVKLAKDSKSSYVTPVAKTFKKKK